MTVPMSHLSSSATGVMERGLVMPLTRALPLSLTLKWHEAKKLSRDPEG
jgi:hypothetical protein